MKYEKIKLTNGSEYEIVPGGLRESSDKTSLTIIALMGDKTLADVDSEFDVAENVEKITVLDSDGEPIDIKKGYRYEVGCKKQKDYVIGREEVVIETADAATTEVSESTETEVPVEKEYRDITGTVAIIELCTKIKTDNHGENSKELVTCDFSGTCKTNKSTCQCQCHDAFNINQFRQSLQHM